MTSVQPARTDTKVNNTETNSCRLALGGQTPREKRTQSCEELTWVSGPPKGGGEGMDSKSLMLRESVT